MIFPNIIHEYNFYFASCESSIYLNSYIRLYYVDGGYSIIVFFFFPVIKANWANFS